MASFGKHLVLVLRSGVENGVSFAEGNCNGRAFRAEFKVDPVSKRDRWQVTADGFSLGERQTIGRELNQHAARNRG